MPNLTKLAKHCHAYILADNEFQRRARILQSIWRVECGYSIGEHNGKPLGSRLPMPWAEHTLANYLTEPIKEVVRREVLDKTRSRDKLFGKPRIFNDLLSSQPLCFNLFGELQQNLDLATAVFKHLTSGRVEQVTLIEFEYSPGRGNPAFLEDRSAFDVFLEYLSPRGGRGFIGIEVKYHESMKDKPGRHRPRYEEVAEEMGCFKPDRLPVLRMKPLQQIWRDHMLAGSLLLEGSYQEGLFVFLYPKDNKCCTQTVERYRNCLSNEQSFDAWEIETFVEALRHCTQETWADQFADRYLAFHKLERKD